MKRWDATYIYPFVRVDSQGFSRSVQLSQSPPPVSSFFMNLNPTSKLPRLKAQPNTRELVRALDLLSKIYAPSLSFHFSSEPLSLPNDSSSSVEDQKLYPGDHVLTEEDVVRIVRSDETERRFAKNWLTTLIGSGLDWIQDDEDHEASLQTEKPRSVVLESDSKRWDVSSMIDLAGNILASEAKVEESDEGLDRSFTFPMSPSPFPQEVYDSWQNSGVPRARQNGSPEQSPRPGPQESESISLTLLDLPLPPSGVGSSQAQLGTSTSASAHHNGDQDSSAIAASAVGLQTWAASIVLSDLLTRDPLWVHSDLRTARRDRKPLRIIELGAGTGLVGLVAAQYLERADLGPISPELKDSIFLTDYHPTVLDHLRSNVNNVMSDLSSQRTKVIVEKLDWEEVDAELRSLTPRCQSAIWVNRSGDSDLILAADVVYSQTHASWLHSTILCSLKVDLQADQKHMRIGKSRAHVLCAKRERGRFGEWALIEGVDKVFGKVFVPADTSSSRREGQMGSPELRVIERRELPKVKGLGRQDEDGWIWWQLAWVSN